MIAFFIIGVKKDLLNLWGKKRKCDIFIHIHNKN